MLTEVKDHFEVLTKAHQSIDKMLENLTAEQWSARPQGTFNSIASVVDHVCRVEHKFMSAVSGQSIDIDTQLPFKEATWDVASIQSTWANMLPEWEGVLEQVTADDLERDGLKLGIGTLNRRQLIVYGMGHTLHHRGQIPLLLKLLAL